MFAFQLPAEQLDVTVDLDATAADRTLATVTVEGPWLSPTGGRSPESGRSTPVQLAFPDRLCQTLGAAAR